MSDSPDTGSADGNALLPELIHQDSVRAERLRLKGSGRPFESAQVPGMSDGMQKQVHLCERVVQMGGDPHVTSAIP